jgi:hypothetical protein
VLGFFQRGPMSLEWSDRVVEMLAADRGTKRRFLEPLLQHILRQGTEHLPTQAQIDRVLKPMWRKHERRRLEQELGPEAAEAYLAQALPW